MEYVENLRAAELLIEASYNISCDVEGYDEKYAQLLDMALEFLKPHIDAGVPKALFLQTKLPNLGLKEKLSNEEYESKYFNLMEKAAIGGCPEAQYHYGCFLYDHKMYDEAVDLYKKSAEQGYAPSQWCYGSDVFHGVGTDKNEELGLYYIRLSAEHRYENAVSFLLNAYKKGEYGFKKDEAEIKKWKRILEQENSLYESECSLLIDGFMPKDD